MRLRSLLVIAFWLVVFPSAALADAVGQILFVHGSVKIISASGETRPANRGGNIFEGDKITSAKASSMQIKMVDGGFLAIRPSTTFRLDTYRFNKDANDRVESSLLKGGLRSITGSIGKNRKESFKLKTPVATIGIRGTDFEAAFLPNAAEGIDSGAYIRVYSGKGYLQTNAGVQFVSPDQTAHAANSSQLPSLLSQTPEFLIRTDESGAENSEEEEETSDSSDPASDSSSNEESSSDSTGDSSDDSDDSSTASDGGADDSSTNSDDEQGNSGSQEGNPGTQTDGTPDSSGSGSQGADGSDQGSGNGITTGGVPEDVSGNVNVNDVPGSNLPSQAPSGGVDPTDTEEVVDNVQEVIDEATGVTDTVITTEDEVLAQDGEFSYQSMPESDTVFFSDKSSSTLDVDFDTGIVLYNLVLIVDPDKVPAAASMDNGGEWHLQGKGTLTDLLNDGLTLTGYYLDYTDGSQHEASGNWSGIFTGTGAEGFTGTLSLNTADDSLQLAGKSVVTERAQLTDYLAGTTQQTDLRFGIVIFKDGLLSLNDFQRFNKDGKLSALVDSSGTKLVVDEGAGTENLVTAGDAEVVWGNWAAWRQVIGSDVTEDAFPIQYIHTDLLTDDDSITSKTGLYQYELAGGSAVNADGELGLVTAGALAIDFSSDLVAMSLDANAGQGNWSVTGEDSIAQLQAGTFSLAGSRLDQTSGLEVDATGEAGGVFAGSAADGVFGFFFLDSGSNALNGTYVFNNPSFNDYLANATEQTNNRLGYLLNNGSFFDIARFGRWQQEGELKALVNGDTQWVAVTASNNENQTQVGDTEVVQGHWSSGWYAITGESLTTEAHPVQYIHTGIQTSNEVVMAKQGLYNFGSVSGQAVNALGVVGSVTGGSLSVNFSEQTLDLALQANVSDISWSAIGSDRIENVQTGDLALTGQRVDSSGSEAITGSLNGQFAGSDAGGLFGYFLMESASDRLDGTYLFSDASLNDFLAGATEQNDLRFGQVTRMGDAQDLDSFVRWQQDGELKALVSDNGTQWVNKDTSGNEVQLQVADAGITLGSWTGSWYEVVGESLSVFSDSIQYIHTDRLTDDGAVTAKQGLYQFNGVTGQVVNTQGELGSITSGGLAIDFSDQSVDLNFQASVGNSDWSVAGQDDIAQLQTGDFGLSGQRINSDGNEAVSGRVLGQFAGSDAQGLFGSFALNSSSDLLQGNYVFSDRSLNDYLADAAQLLDSRLGYVQTNSENFSFEGFSRWQQDGELKAVVDTEGKQWVAQSVSGTEDNLQTGDANIRWGSWTNGWYEISGDVLSEQQNVVPYIHTDLLTTNTVLSALQGRYEFSSLSGQAVNAEGVIGSITGGSLVVDFNEQALDLVLQANAGDADWSVTGQDSLANLQVGNFALSGQRVSGLQEESASGQAIGQFAGSDANALFGLFSLNSESDFLKGSYVFDNKSFLNDYLTGAIEQTDSRKGYVLNNGSRLELADYSRWRSDDELKVLVNGPVHWIATKPSGTEVQVQAGDAEIIWGAWVNGWYELVDDSVSSLTESMQYIHSTVLTSDAVLASKSGQYQFNSIDGQVVNGSDTVGQVTGGGLVVDFSDQSVDLNLQADVDGANWSADGQGVVNDLQSGNFALDGQRTEGGQQESASGSLIGQFAGSDADGLFGTFSLVSSSDLLNGTYLFNDASFNNYLSNAVRQDDNRIGYILKGGDILDVDNYSRWQQDGELKALVSAQDVQWVAVSPSGSESLVQVGDAEVILGYWNNSWYEIVGESLSHFTSVVQYIHSDNVTSNAVVTDKEGLYQFNGVVGQAVNAAGDVTNLISGSLAIDFSEQAVDLSLQASIASDIWSASGQGTISQLQLGGFSLNGTHQDGGLILSASGESSGEFVGNNADGLLGAFYLTSSRDQLSGTYVFNNGELNDYLANAVEQSDNRVGYVLQAGSILNLTDYSRWKESGELKGLIDSSGVQWIAQEPSGTENSIQAGDADIVWGSWINNWYKIEGDAVTSFSDAIQYIHTNTLTSSAVLASKQGAFQFNGIDGQVINNNGTVGRVTDGALSIDFSSQNIYLNLQANVGGATWFAEGQDNIANLQSGDLSLSGLRNKGTQQEFVSGLLQGQFAGNDADGVFGVFSLSGISSQLAGSYAFNDRSFKNYLSDAAELTDSRFGYVLYEDASFALENFSRWQESDELKAFVDTDGIQWVAKESSGSESSVQAGDSNVAWGNWSNNWYEIEGESLIERSNILQYIHTDLLTDSSVIAEKSGLFHFNSVNGQVANSNGDLGSITAGSLSIDFSEQSLDLNLQANVNSVEWSVTGQDDIGRLQSTGLGLSGLRVEGNQEESTSGQLFGQFAGSDADGLFGSFLLNSSNDQLTGSYIFNDRSFNDYLSDATEQSDLRLGYILQSGDTLDLASFSRWNEENKLKAFVDNSRQWISQDSSAVETNVQAGDANIIFGSWANGWYEVVGESLSVFTDSIQYIHSDIVSSDTVVTDKQGLYQFNSVTGQVINNDGNLGSVTGGSLAIDFSEQSVDLGLEASVGSASWAVSGQDSVNSLQMGSFSLNGNRIDGAQENGVSGQLYGLFAGSDAEGVFGTFSLTSSDHLLDGLYIFNDRSFNNYLVDAIEQIDERQGQIVRDGVSFDVSGLTRWRENNELKALTFEGELSTGASVNADPSGQTQWVAKEASGNELSVQAGDASVILGSWTKGWYEIIDDSLTEFSSVLQYNYTDILTPDTLISSKQSIYQFNNLNGQVINADGVLGSITDGHFYIDFSDQLVDLGLEADVGSVNWIADGQGGVSDLRDGNLVLSGQRIDSNILSSATGSLQGNFAGSDADGIFGSFDLASGNDSLSGLYVFTSAENLFASATELKDTKEGYILASGSSYDFSGFTRWEEGGELKAFVDGESDWVALGASNNESSILANDSNIRWGAWTQGWLENLDTNTHPLQYIYTDNLTHNDVIAIKSGVFSFEEIDGNVVNADGSVGSVIDGGLSVDFSADAVALYLSANADEYTWYADGSDSISALQAGTLGLSGERTHASASSNSVETVTGSIQGQFSGSDGDALFGHFSLISSSDSLDGVYAYYSPADLLTNATEMTNTLIGYGIKQGAALDISSHTRWQEDNELKALVDGNNYWVASASSGNEQLISAGDASILWGAWSSGWQESVEFQGHPFQYIFTNSVTDTSVLNNKIGTYSYDFSGGNVVNSTGELGSLNYGSLAVDFDADNVGLLLEASVGDYNWSAEGSDSIASLQAGSFSLIGNRVNNFNSNDTDDASGSLIGEFVGSNADGLFGYFDLTSSSDSLTGVYAFNNPENSLANATEQTEARLGYILHSGLVFNSTNYAHWDESNELKALTSTNSSWISSDISNNEQSLVVDGAEIRWGAWNSGWVEGSEFHEHPLQYIYTDTITDNSVVTAHSGSFNYSLAGGNVVNADGVLGSFTGGALGIDFTSQEVGVFLDASVGDYKWSMDGSGNIFSLQAGTLGLLGNRLNTFNNSEESAAGVLKGQFAGGNPDSVFGYLDIVSGSDTLSGVYAFSSPEDLLGSAILQIDSQSGYVLSKSSLFDLANFDRWNEDGELKALSTEADTWIALSPSTEEYFTTLYDATIRWGAWVNGWQENLDFQDHPLQYIYTDNITSSGLFSEISGVYNFNFAGGNAVNATGDFSALNSGSFGVNYTTGEVDISFDTHLNGFSWAGGGDGEIWAADGTGSITDFQAGTLSLTGTRGYYVNETLEWESASGSLEGEFAGSYADGVFGHFDLVTTNDSLTGVFAFDGAENPLDGTEIDFSAQNGYTVVNSSASAFSLGAYLPLQESGELRGLISFDGTDYWIAGTSSSNQQSVSVDGATVAWGAWTTGWQDNLTLSEHAFQYIYTDQLMDPLDVLNLESIYSFSFAGGNVATDNGEFGSLNSGSLSIDFSADLINLGLNASVGNYSWTVEGDGTVAELQTGLLDLNGNRVHDTDTADIESVTGLIQGGVAGGAVEVEGYEGQAPELTNTQAADEPGGIFGHFSLSSVSDILTGVYVFNNAIDALADTTIDSTTQYGLVIKSGQGSDSDIGLYTRYTDDFAPNNLKALVNGNDYWIASSTGDESTVAVGGANLTWGAWANGWQEGLTFHDHTLQYIYTDVLTPEATINTTSGIFNFDFVGGNVVNSAGDLGVLNYGSLAIDFSADQINLSLDANIGDYDWFVDGSDTITALKAGTFTLSGDREHFNNTADTEVATGSISGVFIGTNLEGVFGQFYLSSTSDSLSGVYVFDNPVDVLATASLDASVQYGHVIKHDGASYSVSDISTYTRYQESGELKALVEGNNYWIAHTPSVNEQTIFANDADIVWGAWTSGWSESLTEHDNSKPLQYIYTDSLTTPAIVAAKTGIHNFSFAGGNVVNGSGDLGSLTSGFLDIDFSADILELYLSASVGDYDWYVEGNGAVTALQAGTLGLSGLRTHYTLPGDTEVASGLIIGDFVGSTLDGVMGQFDLSSASDTLAGVYVFNNPMDALVAATLDTSVQYGHVIKHDAASYSVSDLNTYTRYQESSELKALVEGNNYWFAHTPSSNEQAILANDADIIWGAWTSGWNESLTEHDSSKPLQYIYTDSLTTSATVTAMTGIYGYGLGGGNAVNASGEFGNVHAGYLDIDFSTDAVELHLEASAGNYDWSVDGSGSITTLQAGTLALLGSRTNTIDANDTEGASGQIIGEFAGLNADAVFGYFDLMSDSLDTLTGVYAFNNPMDSLAAATLDTSVQYGHVIKHDAASYSVSDLNTYTRYQESSELKALVEGNNYWIAHTPSSNEQARLANDADIIWGAWTSGWNESLTEHDSSKPLQYIYTDSLTTPATVTAMTGIYGYGLGGGNAVNASGEFGNVHAGYLDIDFSTDAVELHLEASAGNYDWSVDGSGSITTLQAGTLALLGSRTNTIDTNDTEGASGQIIGDFAGLNADAVFGYFDLMSDSLDTLTGVYAFNNPMDPLAAATLDTSVQYGHVIKHDAASYSVSDLNTYTRYQESSELKALVEGNNYWIAHTPSSNEQARLANDADIIWGAWTSGWNESLTEHDSSKPLQYIYTDSLTTPATVTAMTGIYGYGLGGGNAVNASGEFGNVHAGYLDIDFSTDAVELHLEASAGNYDWSVDGSGSITTLQAGTLALLGSRINTDTNDTEGASGQIIGDFAGLNADAVFGYFDLESDSLDRLTGVYAFNNPMDALATATLDSSVQYGHVIKLGSESDLSTYTRYIDSISPNHLKALVNGNDYWIAAATGNESSILVNDADVIWGAWTGGWQEGLTFQNHPIQYIYSDSMSSAGNIAAMSGIYNFAFAGGNVVNGNGDLGSLNGGILDIDFSADLINLSLDASAGDYNWFVNGSDNVAALQAGTFSLSGNRIHHTTAGDDEAASGLLEGNFVGSAVDGVMGHFDLSSTSGSLTGVYVFDKPVTLVSAATVNNRMSLFSEQDDVLVFAEALGLNISTMIYDVNGTLYSFDDTRTAGAEKMYQTVSAGQTVFADYNDGRNDYGWSYWQGYDFSDNSIPASGTSSNHLFHSYIASDYIPDYATHAFVPQKLAYQFKGGAMFSNMAGELTFDPVVTDNAVPGFGINTGLEVDLAEGMMSIDIVVGTDTQGLVAGERTELWYMHAQQSTDYMYSLVDHVHADGASPSASAVLLEGDVSGYDASGNAIDDTATGAWKLLWGGDEGQIMTGGLYFYDSTTSNLAEGVVTFQGEVLEYQRAGDVHGASTGGLSVYQGLSDDVVPVAAQDAHYFDSTGTIDHGTSEFFIDNLGNNSVTAYTSDDGVGGTGDWVKVDDLSAQLTKDQISYTIDTGGSGPLDGAYISGSGQNTIRDESNLSVGNVNWGRWSESAGGEGFESTVYGSDIKQLHYMYSDTITSDAVVSTRGGTASYSFAGGSAPTRMDASGNIAVGGVNHFNVDVDFDSATLDVDLRVLMEGANIDGTALGAAISSLKSGLSLGVTDSSDGGFSGTGTLNGQFVGPDAEGMINVYQLQSVGGDISGSAFLQRSEQVTPQ